MTKVPPEPEQPESTALHGALRGYVLVKAAQSKCPRADEESFKTRLQDIRAYAGDWGEPGDSIAPATLTWRAAIEVISEPPPAEKTLFDKEEGAHAPTRD